jgi:hypothetical protein
VELRVARSGSTGGFSPGRTFGPVVAIVGLGLADGLPDVTGALLSAGLLAGSVEAL